MASRSETAKLLASLELKDKFSPTIKNANKSLGQFDASLDRTQGRAYRAGQQIGTGLKNVGRIAVAGVGIVAANLALGLDSLIKVEKQQAQTTAVLKSTGQVAGVTAEDVRSLSEEYEALNATIGDEVIQGGANLLLTFTNVRKKAFEPALKTALDMNTALGKGPDGLTTTVRLVGKALNDPTKGLGALSRVGITFNKEQTKRIKALQTEGKLYEAQTLILDELNKRFGGSFAAEGDTTAGSIAKFTDAIEDSQRALATASLPAVRNIADALTDLVVDPQIQRGIRELGDNIGRVLSKENVKTGAKVIGEAFQAVSKAAPTIMAGLSTAATVIGKVVDAFGKLPPEVQQLAIGALAVNKLTGGLVTNIAGGVFGALKAMTVRAGVVNVSGPVAGGGVGAAGAAAAGGGLASKLGRVAGGVVGAVTIVGSALAVLETQKQVSEQNTAHSQEIKATLGQMLAQAPTRSALQNSLAGVRQGIKDITSNPLLTLVQGEALDNLRAMEATLQGQLDKQAAFDEKAQQRAAVLKQRTEQTKTAIDATKVKVAAAAAETTRETYRSASRVSSTTRAATSESASRIVGAIRSSRPIVTVSVSATTINKVNAVTARTGNRNDDRYSNDRSGELEYN